MTKHGFTVAPEQTGQRLDKFLSECLPDLSRNRIQGLIADGCVMRLSDAGATITDAALKVKPGQQWQVTIPPAKPMTIEAQDIPLRIIYEDQDLLVIDKPAGLTVHPAPGHDDQTLVNALLAHCGSSLSGIGGVTRPGIVHRLDKDTSGLIVVAKHDAAHHALAEQLANRTLKRTYSAVVWGAPRPSKGTISTQIGRSPSHRKKMAVLKKGGKEATTHYEIQQVFASASEKEPMASLISCQLQTGRTHQIRVHLAHLGHPLVGDTVYGHPSRRHLPMVGRLTDERLAHLLRHFPRQALHARELVLQHPTLLKSLHFQSPLPEDLELLINRLSLLK